MKHGYTLQVHKDNKIYNVFYSLNGREAIYKFNGATYKININPLTPVDDIKASIKGL